MLKNIGKALPEYDNENDDDGNHQHPMHRQDGKKNKEKRHPLKMPLRTDPVTKRIICRFHNYDARSGCKKYNNRSKIQNAEEKENSRAICELDHETCHICLQKGHPAHRCDHLNDPTSVIWKDFCTLTLKNTRPDDYPTNKTVLGDPIVWIGDTATINRHKNDDGDNACPVATSKTTISVSPPRIHGFKLGEDDQLGRCRRQKRIEATYMLRLGRGSVIVDAGAHLGDTVLTLALHARARNRGDLRFVALEPCPEKCDFIRSVVAANDLLETVTVRCAAVGDSIGMARPASNAKDRARRDGSLRYEYCPTSHLAGSAVPADVTDGADSVVQRFKSKGTVSCSANGIESNKPNEENQSQKDRFFSSVPIITLDSICDQISPLGMLHIDVEGWESNVLRGAKNSLTTFPKQRTNKENNDTDSDDHYPCFIIAEAWTKKECLRRGVSGNAEEKIVRVMEEVNGGCDARFRFQRIEDIVDIERNLVYVRKRNGEG